MKNVVIINGSVRKKGTHDLLKDFSKLLAAHNVNSEIINLGEQKIEACAGCERCITKGSCPLKDDVDSIFEKIKEADGIVLGSPIYLRQISGTLKTLIDRGCSWYHRSPLVGKPIMFALSTQVTGIKQAIAYLKDLSVQWGTIYCGSISRNVFNRESLKKDKIPKKFLKYLDGNQRRDYKPSIKEVIEFNTQKVLAIHIVPLDKEYWTSNSYLDLPYYYPCKISAFKRFPGWIYFVFLNNLIGKNKRVKKE